MKMVSLLMRCTRGHEFWLDVERAEDVTMSHVSDVMSPDGYAIYRDRSLIECGPCRLIGEQTYCHVVPGGKLSATVNFKPSKG